MKKLVYDYDSFVNEMFNVGQQVYNEPTLPKEFFEPYDVFDHSIANSRLDTMVTNYNFRPENQAINIEAGDVVRFYRVSPGKFNHAKQLVRKKMLDDIEKYEIEDPKHAIYYHVLEGSKDDPESSRKVEVIGILSASNIDKESEKNQ